MIENNVAEDLETSKMLKRILYLTLEESVRQ